MTGSPTRPIAPSSRPTSQVSSNLSPAQMLAIIQTQQHLLAQCGVVNNTGLNAYGITRHQILNDNVNSLGTCSNACSLFPSILFMSYGRKQANRWSLITFCIFED